MALSKLPVKTVQALMLADELTGLFQRLPKMNAENICKSTGIKKNQAERIEQAIRNYAEKGREDENRLSEYGFRPVCINSDEYPAHLKTIADAPLALYVKGMLPKPHDACISVVGSRKADSYGLEAAFRISKEIASEGVWIVSGMARGIDGAAHSGALSAKGPTAAVWGCGPDTVYPPEHGTMADKIASYGCIITEYPIGTPPAKANFPRRNRIIAAMSVGTIVVQADERSGSLSTANQALEFGREVMAVPGSIFSSLSKGPHSLLMDGAHPVSSGTDALSYLGLKEPSKESELKKKKNIEGMARQIYDIYEMCDGLKPASAIADELSYPAEKIMSALSILESKGLIKCCPGGIFIKT